MGNPSRVDTMCSEVTNAQMPGEAHVGRNVPVSHASVTQLSSEDLLRALVARLGGRHAVTEQLTMLLECGDGVEFSVEDDHITEETPGYCYLRLLDRVEHRDARTIGAYPTVAEVRRFTNGRADPFGIRGVEISVSLVRNLRVAHVRYNSGVTGLRPVSALAALSKDCQIGGYPFDEKYEPFIKLYTLEGCIKLEEGGRNKELGVGHSSAFERALVCVPNDLPFNVPDAAKYPFARYQGLKIFANQVDNAVGWDFIVHLGAKRDETVADRFWVSAFRTTTMLEAYFQLSSSNRSMFMRIVRWVRDPLPGRPGGVQTVPPDWPSNVPNPMHVIMSRYSGFEGWVDTLAEPWPTVCRMALFGIHEPFDPVWWADYQKTVDVYTLYTRLSPDLRVQFQDWVSWIPDGTSAGESTDSVDGYCYLRLFRASKRAAVRAALGINPWVSAVMAILISQPNSWSTNRFSFAIACKEPGIGVAYQQGHVAECPDGMPVSALISMLSGNVRLGSTNDINAMMDLHGGQDQVTTQPTVFPTLPVGGGSGLELTFNWFGLLGKDLVKYPSINFDILREPAFAMLLGTFESVQLLNASFTIQVSTGAQNAIWAAICASGSSLTTEADWLSQPINQIVNGSDAGYVHAVMRLPDVHPFEKELRASSSVGNPTPTFRFSFAGAVGGTGNIKGQFTVRVRGQYPLGHIRVGAPLAGKSLKRQMQRVVSTFQELKMGTTRSPSEQDDEDDDEDDESEDEVPVNKSPPRANAAMARTIVR